MTSHELARLLLAHEELPVAVHANGHTYAEGYHRDSHGPLKVGLMVRGEKGKESGRHVVIGDPYREMVNYPNEWISEWWRPR